MALEVPRGTNRKLELESSPFIASIQCPRHTSRMWNNQPGYEWVWVVTRNLPWLELYLGLRDNLLLIKYFQYNVHSNHEGLTAMNVTCLTLSSCSPHFFHLHVKISWADICSVTNKLQKAFLSVLLLGDKTSVVGGLRIWSYADYRSCCWEELVES